MFIETGEADDMYRFYCKIHIFHGYNCQTILINLLTTPLSHFKGEKTRIFNIKR